MNRSFECFNLVYRGFNVKLQVGAYHGKFYNNVGVINLGGYNDDSECARIRHMHLRVLSKLTYFFVTKTRAKITYNVYISKNNYFICKKSTRDKNHDSLSLSFIRIKRWSFQIPSDFICFFFTMIIYLWKIIYIWRRNNCEIFLQSRALNDRWAYRKFATWNQRLRNARDIMIISHITAVDRRVSGLEFQRKENITLRKKEMRK